MLLSRLAGAAGIIATAIGCRDATSPPDPLVVEVRLERPPVHFITEDPDGPTISCDVDFIAEATGSGKATWRDATFSWYFGSNRTDPLDSESIPAEDIQDSWGQQAIGSGTPLRSSWRFSAGAPFEVEADFHYVVDGKSTTETSTTRFVCGPVPSPGAAPPTITQVTLPAGMTEVQPGDVITVTYAASAADGLWMSGVFIRGPFEAEKLFSERMTSSTQRTATFTVPAGVPLDVPLTITAFAVDVGLREVTRVATPQLRIVDRVPPRIALQFIPGQQTNELAGQFGVGDSLAVTVSATDNNALGWLIYSLGSPANVRDSVQAPPLTQAHIWRLKIPITPEWIGTPVLSLQVKDAGGLTSGITSSAPDSLRFYPTVTYLTTPAVQIPSLPHHLGDFGDMSYDAERRILYIVQTHYKRIVVLNVETMTFSEPIQLPSEPAGLDLTPGGDSLLVALWETKSIGVYPLRLPGVAPSMIPLTVLDTAGAAIGDARPAPYNIRVSSTGVAIIMLTYATRSRDQMVSLDLRTGAQRIRTDAHETSGIYLRTTERTPDHSRIAILSRFCPRTYFAESDTFSPCGEPLSGGGGANVTFDAAAAHATYGALILDSRLHVLRIARSSALALSLDGGFVFEGAERFVRKTRTSDGTVVERFPVPLSAQQLYVTPDGKWLLVFDKFYTGSVARVDLR